MKAIIYKFIVAAIIAGLFNSCFEETGFTGVSDSVNIVGSIAGATLKDSFYVLPRNTKFEVKFEINTSDYIKKVEVYKIKGIPATTDRDEYQPESSLVQMYEKKGVPEGLGTNQLTVTDTMTLGEEEVTYSVYVQDINSAFNTHKVFVLTDIAKFSNTLQDGNPNGSSKTFMSLTSGRSYFVYNTIQDPKGIDLGFAYLETMRDARASLISLDEYWKAGSYPGIANDNYSPIEFRRPTSQDSLRYFDKTVTPGDLKTFFERGTQYPIPSMLKFTPGKIAPNIIKNNVIAFKIRDAYYGMIYVQAVRAHSRPDYTQEITMQFIVQRKTKY